MTWRASPSGSLMVTPGSSVRSTKMRVIGVRVISLRPYLKTPLRRSKKEPPLPL
jgi:hypothetical protein